MKALSSSRISIVLGLALGLMVLWAAATPSVMGADSLIGGWWPYQGAYCCYDDTWDNCDNGEVTGVDDCDTHDLKILLVPGKYWGEPYPPPVCSGPDLCPEICDSDCPN